MKLRGLSSVCAVALLGAGLSAPAFAQIDEIIVTATKREESIQDVPVAVSAYNSVQIERAGIKDLRDLPNLSPSFTMNSSQTESQGTTLRLRGVGTTGNNTGLESAVGVFIDGVYQSRPGIALGELINLEAIEVLRGPQGTLFGRNTSAGALVVRTRKANLENMEAWGNATYGNFNGANIQAGGSYPLIQDQLAVSLAGAWRQQDGFMESVAPGSRLIDDGESRTRDRYYGRGEVNWEPTETISVRLIGDYGDADEQCCDAAIISDPAGAFFGAVNPAVGGARGGVDAFGPDAIKNRESNSEGFRNDFEQWGFSGEFNWDIGFANLTYIGSYRDFEATSLQSSDFVYLPVFQAGEDMTNASDGFQQIETMTHELRLQGNWNRLDWMVGGYYADEDIEELQTLELLDDYAGYIATTAVIAGDDGAEIIAAEISDGFSGAFADNLFTQEATSWSIFTHNTLDITERLSLTLGARYVRDEKDGTFDQLRAESDACTAVKTSGTASGLEIGLSCFPFAAAADGLPLSPVEFPAAQQSFTDDELTYTVSLGYNLTENANVYFTHSHGYKAGGFNLDPTAASGGADPRFKAELTDSYELGLKADLFNNHVRANVAAFLMDMEDFQVLEFTGVQFQTFNVPKAKSSGVEVELVESWEGPGGGRFNLNQSVTFADARYPDDCDGDNITHTAEILAGTNTPVSSLCGFRLTNSALWTGIIGGTYEKDIGGNFTAFFNTSLRAESRRRTSTQPVSPTTGADTVDDYQSANGKVNMRLGFGDIDGGWGIELWGTNIFDQQTRNVTFNTPLRAGSRGAFLEAPRTYGVTIRGRLN